MDTRSGESFQNSRTETQKEKAKGKTGWVLSRHYLQRLEEPEACPDGESNGDNVIKNKLRCVLRSAFYGMKEGVLTGVFIGGFYGIFKFLNGSTSSIFGGTSEGSNHGGGVPQGRKTSSRSRRADVRTYSPLAGKRPSRARSSSISYQEKYSGYKTIEETLYGFTREAREENVFVTRPVRSKEFTQNRLPVKSKKFFESLNPRVDDRKKHGFDKSNERIEIIGYALVKTAGAFESESAGLKSAVYGSPKQSLSEVENGEDDDEAEEEEDPRKKKSSVANSPTLASRQGSGAQRSNTSNASPTKEKSTRSIKRRESELSDGQERVSKTVRSMESGMISQTEKSSASVKSKHTSGSARSDRESVVTSESSTRSGSERPGKDTSVSRGSKSRQSIGTDTGEERTKPSRITIISPKQHSEDSVLMKSLEPEQSEMSSRMSGQDARSRSKESGMQSKHDESKKFSESESRQPRSRQSGVIFTTESTNIYPQKQTPSYLVNADEISNGYVSPTKMLNNDQQSSEHETINSKFSESFLSPGFESSRGELDDVGYTGSNISEFQMRSPLVDSESMSTSFGDQIKTPQESRNWTADRDAAAANESNMTIKTLKQSRSIIFTESRNVSESEGGNLNEVYRSEKSISESVPVSGSRAAAERRSKTSYASRERVSGSRTGSRSQKSYASGNDRSRRSSAEEYMAKTNSSFIQDVRPESRKSSVSKGAAVVAYGTEKSSPADQEESARLGLFSCVADNTMLLCACNCALVLGIVCTVISTTRASLKI